MIPFTSAEILGEGYRAYNFYLSQLRIRIEMAFGLLTTKWRRLRSILNFATRKNAQIIRVCTKLHNFVIRMAHAEGNGAGRVGQFQGDTVNPLTYGILPLECGAGQVSEFGFLESSNVDDDSSPPCSLQWMDFDSSLRDACVADIISSGIWCPRFNIDRNNES